MVGKRVWAGKIAGGGGCKDAGIKAGGVERNVKVKRESRV